MTGLTNFVLRHRRWVICFWIAAFVAGALTAGTTTSRLSLDFSLPGQPGDTTEQKLLDIYGNGGSNPPYIPVVTVPEGTTVEQQKAEIAEVFATLQEQLPQYRVVDYATTGDKVFLTDDERSTYALVFSPPYTGFEFFPEKEIQPILDEQAQATGLDIKLTGYNLLAQGDTSDSDAPSVLVETLLGALGALAVLAFVFASFLALVPLMIAAVAILTTFLVVLGLTYLTDVSFAVQFLIALVGLGVAIDYSLLLVTRWREEREHGRDNHAAIVEAMDHAGRAVVASALTVAISLVALVIVPVPFLRSMGLGGMLIPLVSSAVVLTLLPAFLGGRIGRREVGPTVDWPRIRHENTASRSWRALGRTVVAHRWVAATLATAVLVALIIPLLGIRIGMPRTESLASNGPAVEALETLHGGGVPSGVMSPIESLFSGGAVDAGVPVARRVEGVAAAFAPDNTVWRKDGHAVLESIPVKETVDIGNSRIVERVNDALADVPGFVGSSGAGATVLDYLNAVYRMFPYVLLAIALVTFVLLVRAFRSIVLPLKAVVLNIASVAATFGAVVLFWQHGVGSEAVFGIAATGAINFWLPVIIFAFLFGLSMDYEVFILSRMREEYDRTGSTKAAVVEGIGRTGRLVTSAALILFFAFVALATAPGTDLKVFATALGFGILLDATVVRALLVPALVSLFGRWNWWLPVWAARLVRVEPHPAAPEPRVLPAAQRELERAGVP
jgi:RND superfamily putative drug exporter